MKPHPYFRAYLAGVALPSMIYLAGVSLIAAVTLARGTPLELPRFAVFPVAIVPGVWGLWNMLHVRLRPGWVSLGLHGAILPFLLAPAGYAVLRAFSIVWITPWMLAIGVPVAAVFYYFVWKYLIGALNRVLEIA